MEVVGGSVGGAGSRHSAPKPIKNPWVRGGQSPDSEPVEAFSNHQPTNECASSPPGDDLSSKILRQIEFYFSDANILKDQFMLKSVKATKEGWMKLSTVAGFKRILSLTTNEQDVSDDGYNPNKTNTSKEKAEKTKEKRKEKNPQPTTPPERPQITLTRSGGEGGKVTLIREPRFPPTEESKGFDSGWRELLRLQRLLLNAPDLPEVEPFVVSSSPPSHNVPPSVTEKSPTQVPLDHQQRQSQQEPHQSLMMLDEAIVCVTASIPPTSNGHQ
ncbi:La-related protein 6 [Sparganum proliferum]